MQRDKSCICWTGHRSTAPESSLAARTATLRHGKPVAEISPYVSRKRAAVNPLKGSILYQGDLDTHTWIWYASEDAQLSKQARARIQRADALGVHPVSCWEVAMLSHGGRLKLSVAVTQWVDLALERPKVTLLPFTPAAAIRAARLGGFFPGDPADRFIVGTALEIGAPVVTKDQRIRDWGQVETIW